MRSLEVLGMKFLILYRKIFEENKSKILLEKKCRKLTIRFVHSVIHGIAMDCLGTENICKAF